MQIGSDRAKISQHSLINHQLTGFESYLSRNPKKTMAFAIDHLHAINSFNCLNFYRIFGVVPDKDGNIYVLDRGNQRIPAVIGCSVATVQIKTGDQIRVNGSAGTVEILGG